MLAAIFTARICPLSVLLLLLLLLLLLVEVVVVVCCWIGGFAFSVSASHFQSENDSRGHAKNTQAAAHARQHAHYPHVLAVAHMLAARSCDAGIVALLYMLADECVTRNESK